MLASTCPNAGTCANKAGNSDYVESMLMQQDSSHCSPNKNYHSHTVYPGSKNPGYLKDKPMGFLHFIAYMLPHTKMCKKTTMCALNAA